MKLTYEQSAKLFKALSDANRLKIIDMLSCGEMCACDLLKHFEITQPTLSHHMKILQSSGLIHCKKEGLWNYYSLNVENCKEFVSFLNELTTPKDNCICKED